LDDLNPKSGALGVQRTHCRIGPHSDKSARRTGSAPDSREIAFVVVSIQLRALD
jgi:hypothetical protein